MGNYLFFGAVLIGVAILWQRRTGSGRARIARERLAAAVGMEVDETPNEDPEDRERRRIRPALQRRRWVAYLVGAIIFALFYFLMETPISIALAAGFLLGIIGDMAEDFMMTRQVNRIQGQLADAVDLVIASLRSGAGVMDSIQEATGEAKQPIRLHLEEVVTRLRLGDDPRIALEDLARAIPLETFRLFSMTLAVHWELGGSLASTLSAVGRTIRDRIELSRRLRSQTTEAQFSTMAILGITYGLGALMWTSKPDQMGEFLDSRMGAQIVAAVVVLQGVGLLWMGRLAKMPAFS